MTKLELIAFSILISTLNSNAAANQSLENNQPINPLFEVTYLPVSLAGTATPY